MKRDQRLLNSLPEELKSNPFWNKPHIIRPTTFGSEARSFREIIEDDPYRIEKDIHTWKQLDEHRVTHPRLQITSTWGSLKITAPSPAKYNPNDEKLSKRESFPSISIATKTKDTEYLETMEFAKTIRETSPSHHRSTSLSDSAKNRSKSSNKPKSLDLRSINVEDMRKALLPGPGSYELVMDNELKYVKSPRAVLPKRTPVCNARPRLNFESLELVNQDNLLFNGSYFSDHDPTLKSSAKITLGCRRPLLGQREYPPVGPGDYDDFRYYRVGNPSLTSSSSNLHPRRNTPLIINKNEGRPRKSFPRRNMISGKLL